MTFPLSALKAAFGAVLAMLCLVAPAADVMITKPVRLVVPSPPGGVTDTLARALAERLSRQWGQPVIVENKAGANQTIGTDAVAKSPPDGQTLLVFESSALTISPHLYTKLPYDAAKDLSPLTIVGFLSPVIVVNPSVPANNIVELIALAKARPNSLSYGSFGNGSYAHVAMEQFKREAGVQMVHVPYKGSAPALNDLLGGQISAMLVTINVVDGHAKSGRLRLLAAATPKRLPTHPDLPTVSESGLPGFAPQAWIGVAAPKGMAPPLIDKIYSDLATILADPQFKAQWLTAIGVQPAVVTPVEFQTFLRTESVRWGAAVKAADVTRE